MRTETKSSPAMTIAFALSCGLFGTRVAQAPRCVRRKNAPRMEVSLGSILTEGVALATLAVGVLYFSRAVQEREAAGTADSAAEAPPEPAPDEGILGLMGGSRSEPLPASFASNSASRLSAPAEPPVPVFIDPATQARERHAEEIAWAFATLSDLGAVSTVLVDAKGTVLRLEGRLIQADPEMKGIVQQVSQSHEKEILAVAGNEQFPFLRDTVRSVACYPVGRAGSVLVIASEENGFFGQIELRVAGAVVARLSKFLEASAEIEQGR